MNTIKHRILTLFILVVYGFTGIVGAYHYHNISNQQSSVVIEYTAADGHDAYPVDHQCGICAQLSLQTMPIVEHQECLNVYLSWKNISVAAVDNILTLDGYRVKSLRGPPII